jgi:catechol 2,3-dioxygenase-like lactoylglutathione lyase family enzyme
MLCLLALVAAQAPGRGISKNTVAVSEGRVTQCYEWKMKYLPVEDADDSCQNNKCQCGATARVALKTSSASGKLGVSPGFGIHGVYAAGTGGSRAKASGNLTVEQVEDIFTQQLGDMSQYSPYMDYRLGLQVSSLDSYAAAFKSGNQKYLPLTWTSGGKTYYSLIVQNPGTQEVFELVADQKPSGVEFQAHDGPRHAFLGEETVEAGRASALHVSRTSRDLATTVAFYKEVFGIDPVDQGTSGGAKYAFFQHNSQATVQIQYWERPQTGEHTTQWFEQYLEAVNAEYMTSYKSCWPVWGDNHYCLDSQQLDMSKIKETYDQKGYKYHLFSMPGRSLGGRGGRAYGQTTRPRLGASRGGKGGNGYFELPGGWQMQIDGYWSGSFPSDADQFNPTYCGNKCGGGGPSPSPSPKPSPSPSPGPMPSPSPSLSQMWI